MIRIRKNQTDDFLIYCYTLSVTQKFNVLLLTVDDWLNFQNLSLCLQRGETRPLLTLDLLFLVLFHLVVDWSEEDLGGEKENQLEVVVVEALGLNGIVFIG